MSRDHVFADIILVDQYHWVRGFAQNIPRRMGVRKNCILAWQEEEFAETKKMEQSENFDVSDTIEILKRACRMGINKETRQEFSNRLFQYCSYAAHAEFPGGCKKF